MLRDGNRHPYTSLDSFDIIKASPGAFVGGTANARGDHDGTSDPTTLFTVTGDVEVGIFGVCPTLLAGATATIEVGVAGNTAGLIAQTTATEIDANEIWLDSSPSVGFDVVDALSFHLIVNGMDIIETLKTANITSGELYYVCMFRPLTLGSSVKVA
jgi:hypothetical protein